MDKPNSNEVSISASNLERDIDDALNQNHPPTTTFRLYKERYMIATVVCMLQITNGALWVTFTPITNVAAGYFNTSLRNINMLAVVNFIVDAIFTFPAMWTINKYGLKTVIYVTALSNVIGGTIRMFGTFDFVPETYRYPVTLIGQIINSIGFPFIMCAPTTISQHWFPDNQRIYCTTICTMTSIVGSAIGSILPPYLSPSPSKLYVMNLSFCSANILVSLTAFMARHSKPPTPPSKSAELSQLNKPILFELRQIFTNKDVILLALCGGGLAIAIPTSLNTILQQILCPWGYSNIYVGLITCILIATSVLASPFLGFLAEKTKSYEETLKIGFTIGNVFLTASLLTLPLANFQVYLMIIVILYGIASTALCPLVCEFGVETAYPANQGIVGNLMIFSGNLQSAILVPIASYFQRPLNEVEIERQTCETSGLTDIYDMTYCGIFLLVVNTIECVIFILFFRGKYERKKVENCANPTLSQPQ